MELTGGIAELLNCTSNFEVYSHERVYRDHATSEDEDEDEDERKEIDQARCQCGAALYFMSECLAPGVAERHNCRWIEITCMN